MNLPNFGQKIEESKEAIMLKRDIKMLFKLFLAVAEVDSLSFYKYNYEYNDFLYEFTIDKDGKNIDIEDINGKRYEVFLKDKDFTYGKVVVYDNIKSSNGLKKLLKELKGYLHQQYEMEKEQSGTESSFSIHVIHDEVLDEFAHNLRGGLKGLFNVDVFLDTNLDKHMAEFRSKEIKRVLIYLVNDDAIIKRDQELIKKMNELIIVIGPNDHILSMLCGKMGVQNYIPINEFRAEDIKSIIINTRKKLINKNKFDNKIIALSGISGGIGTTTIAMNMSNLLSKNLMDKNVLYIDLSITKGISNLFLGGNPLPEKNILDLVNSGEFNVGKNLENGLVRVRENFYAVTGIQRHIDKELIEQDTFIEKLLDYIVQSSEYFNFIIIDLGVADASNLKTTIFDLVNEIWLVTEMSLPYVSKLKTFYSLMKRAGLKEKLSFVVNRYDSKNAISVSDVTSILNMTHEEELGLILKIPNDYNTLGKAWNYCELASQVSSDSPFVNILEQILIEKGFYSYEKEEKKGFFSFFK